MQKLNNMDIFKETQQGLTLTLDKISKSIITDYSQKVVHNVMEGNEYALEQYIKAKAVSEIANSIMDGLKELAIQEADNYNPNDKVSGCSFQIKSVASTYDFSHDDEWRSIQEDMEKLKNLLKAREKQMIDACNYAELVDKNGEVIPPAVVKKPGGSTIAIVIPKD